MGNDILLFGLVVAMALFCGFLLLLRLVMWADGFYREWFYVRSELRRVEEDERPYWIARRRRLWLSLLPFVSYRIDV